MNGGKSWTKINNNLPTVAIHEIAIHPTAEEIVVATHGRSLWVLDVSALRQVKPTVLAESAHLFKPATAIRWRSEPFRGTIYGMGHRHYLGQDPSRGASIYYSLTGKPKSAKLQIFDYMGRAVRDLQVEVA